MLWSANVLFGLPTARASRSGAIGCPSAVQISPLGCIVGRGLAAFGHIGVLVNALGDSIRKPLVTLPGKEDAAVGVSDDELRFIIDVNLTEALLCTRAVGPHMLQRRSGKVINIAS
jgi:NAD(P)-dependent dehydrogenase (short-subunit alcohol dehydrogenase family)